MSRENFEKWYIPPIKGMFVKIREGSTNYERYNQQSGGGTGYIAQLEIPRSELLAWYPNQYVDAYRITVIWENGEGNEYRIQDLEPTFEFREGTPAYVLSSGDTIKKEGNYKDILIAHIIEKGRSIKKTIITNGFDYNEYLEYLNSNIDIIQHKLIKGTQEEYHPEMLNALYDMRDKVEKHTKQDSENEASGADIF